MTCKEKRVKRGLRNYETEEKSYSGIIRRDARLRKRSKEHGSGRSGRTDFRIEYDQCSAKAVVSMLKSVQRKDSQLLTVDVGGD